MIHLATARGTETDQPFFAITSECFKIEIPRSMKSLQLNINSGRVRSLLIAVAASAAFSLPVCAQQTDPPSPVIVQPGAPGQPTRRLPPSTRPTLPSTSPKDVEFMQGMIMHHAQAVEMTALI